MRKSVVIIGAGVVGLTLARELASHGIDTKVYESKKTVSEGAARASGILSIAGLGSTGIPYERCITNRLSGAVLHAGKETLKIKAKEAKAYLIDRGALAESCMESAKEAGAEVQLGTRMGIGELLDLASDRNSILVGADGAVSSVASTFGFPSIDEYILTYKAEYDDADIEDQSMVDLFFSNRIARRFFGWTAPHSGSRVEIGLGISSKVKVNSYAAFESFLGSGALGNLLDGARKTSGYASIIPLSFRKVTVKDNVVLVGDAAGQIKATTGGGIIFGCLCAGVLAKVIAENAKGASRLSVYDREWRARYGTELKMHGLLHEYYSMLNTRSFETLFKLSRVFGLEDFLSRYGDMDRPSLMLKRFFLRGLAK
jgi:flavin-dependent dehydrogenase